MKTRFLAFLAAAVCGIFLAACAGSTPGPVNIQGTVDAALKATQQAQTSLKATVDAAVAATRGAPLATPAPTLNALQATVQAAAAATQAAAGQATAPTSTVAAPPQPTSTLRPTLAAPPAEARQATLTLPTAAEVWAISYSPDGRQIATASQDGQVWTWDALTGKPLVSFKGHTREVTGVAFSADGKRLATSSWDSTVRLWDAATGAELNGFAQSITIGGSKQNLRLNNVVFGPGDAWLLTSAQDYTVRSIDINTGAELHKTGLDGLHEAALSADGRWIALGGGSIMDWVARAAIVDTNSWQKVRTFQVDRAGWFGTTRFSPDGRILATGDTGTVEGRSAIYLWDAARGEQLRQLAGHKRPVLRLAFSPDGRQLAACEDTTAVILWEIASGQALHKIGSTRSGSTDQCGLAFSPDGRYLAVTGDKKGAVNIWKVAALP